MRHPLLYYLLVLNILLLFFILIETIAYIVNKITAADTVTIKNELVTNFVTLLIKYSISLLSKDSVHTSLVFPRM